MRKLAVFSFSFAAGAAAYIWLLTQRAALMLAALLGLIVLVSLFFSGKPAKRVRIGAFGLAAALLWSWGYEQIVLEPRRALCAQEQSLTALVVDTPMQTELGSCVTVRLPEGRAVLYLDCAPDALSIGDRVSLKATVRDATGAGEFDSLYYQSKGISLLAYQTGAMQVEHPERLPVSCWAVFCTSVLRRQIGTIFSGDAAPFARALLTGDTSGLSFETRNQLSITGIAHMVSVSGMHVSLLVGIVMLLTRRRRRLSALVCIPVTVFFAAMLGFAPSVTRVVVMNAVVLMAPILHRENDGPTSLGLALLLILIVNPWAIASVSLQLSFASMVGLFWLTPRLYAWAMGRFSPKKLRAMPSLLRKALHSGVSILAASLGATALTAPLVAIYFGMISIIGPLTNLLVQPLLSLTFSAGFVAVLLSPCRPLGLLLGRALSGIIRFALDIVALCADVPYAAVYTQSVYIIAWLLVAYAMLIVFLLRKKTCRPRTLACWLVITLLCGIAFSGFSEKEASITAFDVGQEQCILLRAEGITAMVDCGGDEGDENGEAVARSLLMDGIPYLDVLVLTHFDTDHVCGVEQLLSRVSVGQLFVPMAESSNNRAEIYVLAQEYGITVTEVTSTTTIEFSTGILQLLPPEDPMQDNASLAALMTVDDYDILITGDMNISGERYLLHTYDLPDLEVLVAGHHGSKYSTATELLTRTAPDVVIISVGENSYGHPSSEALGRIAACGATIYRTDLDGTVTISKNDD